MSKQTRQIQDLFEGALIGLMRLMPVPAVSAIGAWLGEREMKRGLRRNTAWSRRFARNMEYFYGPLSPEQKQAKLFEYGRQAGRVYAEFAVVQKIVRQQRVELIGAENLQDRGRPIIFIAPHIANWELIGCAASLVTRPSCILYEPRVSDARMRIANRARSSWGAKVTLVSSQSESPLRNLTRHLGDGDNLVILADEEGGGYVRAPAFGRELPYEGNRWIAARLAVRYDALLQPIHVERIGKTRFKVTIEPPLTSDRSASPGVRARNLADQVDALFEQWVRKTPEHWYWMTNLDLNRP